MNELRALLEAFGLRSHEHEWNTSVTIYHESDTAKKYPFYECTVNRCNTVVSVGYYQRHKNEVIR